MAKYTKEMEMHKIGIATWIATIVFSILGMMYEPCAYIAGALVPVQFYFFQRQISR